MSWIPWIDRKITGPLPSSRLSPWIPNTLSAKNTDTLWISIRPFMIPPPTTVDIQIPNTFSSVWWILIALISFVLLKWLTEGQKGTHLFRFSSNNTSYIIFYLSYMSLIDSIIVSNIQNVDSSKGYYIIYSNDSNLCFFCQGTDFIRYYVTNFWSLTVISN